MGWIRARLGKMGDANVTVQEIQAVGGGGFRSQPIQFFVRGSDMDELVRVTDALKKELTTIPGLVDFDTTYRGGKPVAIPHRSGSRGRSGRPRVFHRDDRAVFDGGRSGQ